MFWKRRVYGGLLGVVLKYAEWTSRNSKKENSIFVNEVFQSEKLQTFEFDKLHGIYRYSAKKPFNKHVHKSNPQVIEEIQKRS